MEEVESDVLEDADELKEASDSEEELEDAPSELEALGLLQRVQASGALQRSDLKQARAIPIATGSALAFACSEQHARSYKLSRPKPSS